MKHQLTFIISLVTLALVALTACMQVSAEEAIETEPQQVEAVPPIIEATETDSNSDFFAANPELMAASRHVFEAEDEPLGDSDLYAANPELMVAQRYEPPSIQVASESTFYANNPELMVVKRYSIDEALSDSDMLAANPELKVVRQYTAAAQK